MAVRNILILVHGMIPETTPGDHAEEYRRLRQALDQRQPRLARAIDAQIGIEWGHELPVEPPEGPSPDQRITRAENFLHRQVSFESVQADPSPDNHLLPGLAELFSRLVTRRITTPIKETVLLLGLTDVLYYCSPDGERAVRDSVYGQLLKGLEPFEAEETLRLHVVAQSLGVTVAFDFLFGLFAPSEQWQEGVPDFVRENLGTPRAQAYMRWRTRAQNRTLLLGSKSSTGGQLPLMMMRKQKLVDRLFRGERLDPTVISVPADGPARWKLFYDVDDVLAFPTRPIFQSRGSIQEYQVDTDWRPDLAHVRYWEEDQVLDEIAALIDANL